MIYLIGFDPGFANLGYARIALNGTASQITDLGVFKTIKSDAKRKVLCADDNIRRIQEVAQFLFETIMPLGAQILCAESMSHPRNASAAAKMAMTWGVIASISHKYRLPILQASPKEVKLRVCGSADASKEDIEAQIKKRYPNAEGLLKGTAPSNRNHAYDAAASIVACLNTDTVKLIANVTAASQH